MKVDSYQLSVVGTIGILCILPIINGASLTSLTGPTHKCMDRDCQVGRLEKAAQMIEYRDNMVDPCDNFHKFACGNWKETPMNSQEMMHAMRSAMINEMILKTTGKEKSKAHKLIHDFYSTCMDDGARGDKPLELFKSMIMDSWPLTAGEKWNKTDFCWMDWMGKAKKTGFISSPFIDWEPELSPDEVRTIRHRLHMPTNLFQFKGYALENEYNKPYRNYMIAAAQLLGATNETSQEELAPVYDFEKRLYMASLKRNSGETGDMTIDDMQRDFPKINWTMFVEKTLTPFVDPGQKTIITVQNPAALTKFMNLIYNTPKRVLASYAIWKEFQSTMPYLKEEFKELHSSFHKEMEFSEIPQDEFCKGLTKKFVQFGIDDWVMEQLSDSKMLIEKMFSMLKDSLTEMVQESNLTDDEKHKGVEILAALDYTIGGSKKFKDRSELDAFYGDATVDKENFLQTLLNMNAFLIKKQNSLEVFDDVVQDPKIPATLLNFPRNSENHLFIPFSMIPSQSFNENHPAYVNFGTAGSKMARVMFVSLRNLGKTMDDLKENPNDQMKCFQNLAKNITDPTMKEVFEQVLVDDIVGQYFGFRAAYRAYKQYTVEMGPELGLSDLPYTTDQLFWLSFANSGCNFRDGAQKRLLTVNGFNLVDFLTITIMRNIPEIAEAFECPVGSNMNPVDKCTWW